MITTDWSEANSNQPTNERNLILRHTLNHQRRFINHTTESVNAITTNTIGNIYNITLSLNAWVMVFVRTDWLHFYPNRRPYALGLYCSLFRDRLIGLLGSLFSRHCRLFVSSEAVTIFHIAIALTTTFQIDRRRRLHVCVVKYKLTSVCEVEVDDNERCICATLLVQLK